MPFTPFHFGPGLLVKGIAGKWYSLSAFIATQVVIDCETLYHLMRRDEWVHRTLHTFLGSTLVGVATAFSLIACRQLIGLLSQRFATAIQAAPQWIRSEVTNLGIWSGALVGGLSHPLLDGVIHRDIRPLDPWSNANPFLGVVGARELHLACVAAGLLGLGLVAGRVTVRRMSIRQTNSINAIEASQNILSKYANELAHVLEREGQNKDAPALMIFTGIGFADETYSTLKHVLNGGSDVLCATLVRPVFEMSIHLLWATGEPDGWARLQKSWALRKDKWIKAAAPYPESKPLADSFRPKVESVLRRLDAHGKEFRNAPNVREMLEQIDKHDGARGMSTPCDNWAAQYPGVYQILCGPSHADLMDIGKLKAGRFEKMVVTAVMAATWALLRVCCDVMYFADPNEKARRTKAAGDEYATLIEAADSAHSCS